jgi:hypothetical protein
MQMTPRLSPKDEAAHAALRDQLAALVPADARVTAHGWRPWASASFAGARHWFDVAAAALDAALLGERDWPLAAAFVADVAVHADEPAPGAWRIELLVVDD